VLKANIGWDDLSGLKLPKHGQYCRSSMYRHDNRVGGFTISRSKHTFQQSLRSNRLLYTYRDRLLDSTLINYYELDERKIASPLSRCRRAFLFR
jgi:hypothetical protein